MKTVYRSEDGKIFESPEACKEYERVQIVLEGLEQALSEEYSNETVETVMRVMREQSDLIQYYVLQIKGEGRKRK